MKIANSNLSFSAQRTALELYEVKESLDVWQWSRDGSKGRRLLKEEANESGNAISKNPSANVNLSKLGLSLTNEEATEIGETINIKRQIDKDPHLNMMRLAVEILTGRKVSLVDAEFRDPKEAGSVGITYRRHETYTEFEEPDFAAEGVVKTADGREISFSLQLSMSRLFIEENHTRIGWGTMIDPLVLNFSGTAAQLSDATFRFDLDCDGQEDDMPILAQGSGYLVFDRNGDGKVNNGSELFGALTGDGFAELAALDDDGNGWIDENDRAWEQLRVWTKDADGTDVLRTLLEANVGAIALQNIATPFSIKDHTNQLQAQIQSTGVFLKENGGVGTIQKIDVVV